MLKDFQNLSIFNAQNPAMIAPRSTKIFPFPFEDLDAELAEIYLKMSVVLTKFDAAKINPSNDSVKRHETIDSMKYKVKSAMSLIKATSEQGQQMSI